MTIITSYVTIFDKAGFHTHNGKAHSGLSNVLECLGGLQMAAVSLEKHPHGWKLPYNCPTICDIWNLGVWHAMCNKINATTTNKFGRNITLTQHNITPT